ncbi:hypothetical protein ARMSODRAFT_961816 [Armillaria solidipes]|uniref:Uncharacterized protein n=1 Tax=Armillaria solidipes TaxID=1076256 RepID=A0A2H3B4M4_9AGAR|nr:hypothetical protein ARMSODRAFT_961816 [Armillaria solidipes]
MAFPYLLTFEVSHTIAPPASWASHMNTIDHEHDNQVTNYNRGGLRLEKECSAFHRWRKYIARCVYLQSIAILLLYTSHPCKGLHAVLDSSTRRSQLSLRNLTKNCRLENWTLCPVFCCPRRLSIGAVLSRYILDIKAALEENRERTPLPRDLPELNPRASL